MPIGIILALLSLADPKPSDGGSPNEEPRRVAITIDDLPYVGEPNSARFTRSHTRRITAPLKAGKVPVTAFVIGGDFKNFTDKNSRRILQIWREAGAELGNHTWTHPDLDHTKLADYEAEIMRTDAFLHRLFGPAPIRYFRPPYLNESPTAEVKAGLQTFLRDHGYTDSPVTIDTEDWLFAGAYNTTYNRGNFATARRIASAYLQYMAKDVAHFEAVSREVLGRECAQILLIHSSRLNATTMPQLLAMFRRRHYRFISLAEALRDPAYQSPENYVGTNGLSWLYRWSLAKKIPIHPGPVAPKWVQPLAK